MFTFRLSVLVLIQAAAFMIVNGLPEPRAEATSLDLCGWEGKYPPSVLLAPPVADRCR
ncbi:hypothetical protein BDP27DRAFT_1413633 [Rhodocollybia butyracea]|uniref:Uncharacterized protein n=1 Tax=Rhodocollybia butyracea TaxID=206335 RepID=A0A9P5UFE6_9AGAR|nr:hypothetical protein BDP27DRAFT_1413633 [Rhodocollybia butyracea]